MQYNLGREDFTNDHDYNVYLEEKEFISKRTKNLSLFKVQASISGTDQDKKEAKHLFSAHVKTNLNRINQASERRKEINKNLDAIIKVENAKLCFNHYERLNLERQIDPREKERAAKLIERLDLDKMEKMLTNQALERREAQEDQEMKVEEQK